MTKRKNPWLQVFYYSLVLMVLFGVYYMFQAQDFKLINIVIKSMTNVGMFMVGQSLFIGPLGKFWDRFDKYIHYRKMLGVLGYYYLLLHAVFAMILYVLPRGTYSTLTLFSLGFGLTGLFLFHFCTEISDIDTIRSMGANAWRRTLRYLSYGGFIAGLIHIIISRWKWEWAPYLTESQKMFALPPLSILVAIFAGIVLSLRLYTFIYDISPRTEVPTPSKKVSKNRV
jgi:DMSO/TMAO reductase YedYZ heme-binding membrane subunit